MKITNLKFRVGAKLSCGLDTLVLALVDGFLRSIERHPFHIQFSTGSAGLSTVPTFRSRKGSVSIIDQTYRRISARFARASIKIVRETPDRVRIVFAAILCVMFVNFPETWSLLPTYEAITSLV